MKKYSIIAASLLSMWTATSVAQSSNASEAALDARAKAIHQRVLTFDSHADVLLPSTPKRYWDKDGTSAIDLAKLQAGGIDALALAVAVGPGPRTAEGDAAARIEAEERWTEIQAFVQRHRDKVAIAKSAADIERLHADGKIVVLPSFLNARSLEGNVGAIDEWYRRGVRIFAFTHAGNNAFADSSRPQEEPLVEHHGLSTLGKQAIPRLNALGIVIDVSQLTPEGVFQTLELTKAPVIASHSAVRALVDNTRNLSDQELDAIKQNGGVVHVTPFNAYLKNLPSDFAANVRAIRTKHGLPASFSGANYVEEYDRLDANKQDPFLDDISALVPRATLADFVDHIDYIVKRIGIDHVGIGTDFNHGAGITGFANASEAVNVTRELLKRGYTEEQIAKIWSSNFLRVFKQVEAIARAQRAS